MAHWIIDDRGFGGMFYTCSNCGRVFSSIISKNDPAMWDTCKDCGAKFTEEDVYTDDESRPPKKKIKIFEKFKRKEKQTRSKIGQLTFGVDIKRCDECECKKDHRETMVFYLCDQKACIGDCTYPDCKHTPKIEHAKNFKPNMELGIYNGFNDYWEVEDES